MIKKKEIKQETPKKVDLPKIEDVEKLKPEIVSQSVKPTKQETASRQLPETNSDSMSGLAALSAVSTLGVGFAAIRRKRQSA